MPSRGSRIVVPVTIVAFALAVAGAIFFRLPHGGGRPGGFVVSFLGRREPAVAHRILVAPFDNATDDASLDAAGNALAHWIAKGLSRSPNVDVVSPLLARALAPQVDSLRWPTRRWNRALALADETLAGIVVRGRLDGTAASPSATVEIVDAGAGTVLRTLAPVAVARGEPLAAAESLRRAIVRALPDSVLRGGGDALLDPLAPPRAASYEAYLDGVRDMGRDTRAALRDFRQAAALDTGFVLPLVLGGGTAMDLGDDRLADSLLAAAEPRRDRLVPYDALLLDRMRALRVNDYARALVAARRMWAIAPASHAPFFVVLDGAQENRPRLVLSALRELSPDRGLLRGNSRYWHDLAWCYHQLEQHPAELGAARAGRARFPDDITMVDAEMRALAAMGRGRELWAAVDSARALRPVGALNWRALAFRAIDELRAHGHAAEAQPIADRLVAYYRQRPETDERASRPVLATALIAAGQLAPAESLLRAVVAEHPDDVESRGRLGALQARRGEGAAAESIAAGLAAADTDSAATTLHLWRARIAARLGQRDRALALLRESFARGLGHRYYWLHADPDFEGLKGEAEFQDMVRPRD